INNPHIVEVTDLVEDGELRPPVSDLDARSTTRVNALVMELLEGQSLGQAIAGGPAMAPARFLPLMAQVCRALAAAHGAGFAHRDLKPENIFLVDRSGQEDFVKLLDFGLTKMVEADPLAPAPTGLGAPSNPALATLEGTFVGTPGYVS